LPAQNWAVTDGETFEDVEEGARPPLELPQFALAVAAAAEGQWRIAALVKETSRPDFYVRSIRVPWPFIIARPARSNRQNDVFVRPEDLSPAGTSPTRKLVVNWAWEPIDETAEQLRFFVKRGGPGWLWPVRPLRLRIGLKEQPPPRRQFSLRVRGNRLDWR
jgi:hypothetical protein